MKRILLGLMSAAGISAAANTSTAAAPADVKYAALCTVLEQPSSTSQGKLLAHANVSLKAGEEKVIYRDGNVLFKVWVEKTGPVYTAEVLITYGDPNFLGAGQASYSEAMATAHQYPGVGVALPGFPTFGCGPQ